MKDILFLLAQAPDSELLGLPEVDADDTAVQSIMAVVFGIAAAVAVLVIVLASINFITGGGDPDKIARAKKSIIFALVGLAIAVTAEILVFTVLERL